MGVLVSIYCSNYSTKQQVSTTVHLIHVFLIAFGQQRRSIEQMYQAMNTQCTQLFFSQGSSFKIILIKAQNRWISLQ